MGQRAEGRSQKPEVRGRRAEGSGVSIFIYGSVWADEVTDSVEDAIDFKKLEKF